MSRILLSISVTAACVFAAVGLLLTSAAPQHPTRLGSPNFICISTPHFGICIGPPTKQG